MLTVIPAVSMKSQTCRHHGQSLGMGSMFRRSITMGILSRVAPRSMYPSKLGMLYDMEASRRYLLKKFKRGIPKVMR